MEKKTSCLLCVLTALLLTVLYLWAALRPGVWLRDAFLYRQADGSFSGRDAYAAYTMQIAQTGNGAEVEFTLDGETRRYRLESKAEGMSDPGVKIEQDGVVIFTGTALGDPGDAILWKEDDGGLADEVNVIVNGEYQRSDLWPSCNWLYNVAVGGRPGAAWRSCCRSGRWWCSLCWMSGSRCCSGTSATGWKCTAVSPPTGITRCRG